MALVFWKEAVRIKLLPLMLALFRLRVTQERANRDFLSKCYVVEGGSPLSRLSFLSNALSSIDYMAAATIRLNESRLSNVGRDLLHTVLVFMRSMWYPVQEYLEPMERQPNDRYEMWMPLIALWEDLGLACGLSESDTNIESPESWSEQVLRSRSNGFTRAGCSWPQCLCSLTPHHGMKICKGCWQTRYCSRQCQVMYALRQSIMSFLDCSFPILY